MKLQDMLTNIRLRLGGPDAQCPSDRTLLLLLSTQLQNFYTEAGLSGTGLVDEVPLTISPNTPDYIISTPDFGKPLQVLTYDPGNPNHIVRNIPFTDIGDLYFDWPFSTDYTPGFSADGSAHTLDRIAFFRQAGNIHARVLPIPAAPANYIVRYQIGVYGNTTPLDEEPALIEHHPLVEVRTSLAGLPHCKWGGEDNPVLYDRLTNTLLAEVGMLTKNFRLYISTVTGNNDITERWAPVPYE